MKKKMSLFSESDYQTILCEYGSSTYTVINNVDDLHPCIIKNINSDHDWRIAVTCSGIIFEDKYIGYQRPYSIDVDKKHIVPANSQIILVRYFRECNHDGILHYNVDDQLIYPCKDGYIYRFSRKDSPDHYIELIETSSLASIGTVYSLPVEKSGKIEDYKVNGAIYPIHAFHV